MATPKENLKEARDSLADGLGALATKAKEMLVGAGEKGKAFSGGLFGVAKWIGEKAIAVVAGVGTAVGKVWQKAAGLTVIAGVVAAGVAVHSYFKKRDKQKELTQLQKGNELLETAATNNDMQSQLAAMPDQNPNARNDFVQKYGSRAANQSQSAARA